MAFPFISDQLVGKKCWKVTVGYQFGSGFKTNVGYDDDAACSAQPHHAHLPPLRIFLPFMHLVQRPAESQAAHAAGHDVHTPCLEVYSGFLAASVGRHLVQRAGAVPLQAWQDEAWAPVGLQATHLPATSA